MTAKSKLETKLLRGKISANQLRTLLHYKGWYIDRISGSHEIWCREAKTFVLATHSKDLKPYQIREAQECLFGDEENDKKEKV
jgi:predicted RNA binding protein YcfA (HicA-like mRNA interferase family)